MSADQLWLALAIGNSRLHWAIFVGATLLSTWEIDHLPVDRGAEMIQQWAAGEWSEAIFPPSKVPSWVSSASHKGAIPLYLASVVPDRTRLIEAYPYSRAISLEQLPLLGLYQTLGIDRALAVLGAGTEMGWPVLVIDAGTALTLTGADANRQLVGGAILPGLRLQLQSLAANTAALPVVQTRPSLPARWANTTVDAISSGIVYTLLAGIQDFIADWCQQFPETAIVLTGGDRAILLSYLQAHAPAVAAAIIPDPHLIFWGMRSIVNG
ncbi:MAG: pantothenate kinase [Hormoscilla sp. SP12CHS1]|nr:pantothenate kinase [Hormoscilla sp. SP12CHS1]